MDRGHLPAPSSADEFQVNMTSRSRGLASPFATMARILAFTCSCVSLAPCHTKRIRAGAARAFSSWSTRRSADGLCFHAMIALVPHAALIVCGRSGGVALQAHDPLLESRQVEHAREGVHQLDQLARLRGRELALRD